MKEETYKMTYTIKDHEINGKSKSKITFPFFITLNSKYGSNFFYISDKPSLFKTSLYILKIILNKFHYSGEDKIIIKEIIKENNGLAAYGFLSYKTDGFLSYKTEQDGYFYNLFEKKYFTNIETVEGKLKMPENMKPIKCDHCGEFISYENDFCYEESPDSYYSEEVIIHVCPKCNKR